MNPKLAFFTVIVFQIITTSALNKPSCAPGGNFNLSFWELQLPSGKPRHPITISSSSLKGCNGYHNDKYFFTNKGNGALVMKVPGAPPKCVTTTNSKHCRTELREVDPVTGHTISWSPSASKNRLNATLSVPKPDNSTYGTVVGQIHIDDTVSSKPVCELYYSKTGDINIGVEKSRSGGQVVKFVRNVPVGKKFSYSLRYEQDKLSLSVNGDKAQILDTFDLNSPKSYFKVGNYDQGNSSSEVHFFTIAVEHPGPAGTNLYSEDTTAQFSHQPIKQLEKPLIDLISC